MKKLIYRNFKNIIDYTLKQNWYVLKNSNQKQ